MKICSCCFCSEIFPSLFIPFVSALERPVLGQQKGISEFFSVTGVISTSPNKSSQPCFSTHKSGLSGELFQRHVTEEEEDDDVSLLAAPLVPEAEEEVGNGSLLAVEMVPECGVKEEEDDVDDESLLAAEKMPDPRIKEEAEDYLEGMTSEMFGDDDEFDRRHGYIEEEEVEALPDTHYGLLGSSRALIRPQGCMDDLPEEVLRQILSLLPAQDLYRNGSLVCHCWRNIIQDTKVKQTVILSCILAKLLYV